MGGRAAATPTYLDFERPLERLDAEIARLAGASPGTAEAERLRRLRAERRRVQQELLARLTPWERVQLSRHPDRPSALDYLGVLCRDLVELHGDRRFGEDGAIVGGLARFRGHAVVVVAQQRGRSTAERVLRNFGMPRPEGYRKAVRAPAGAAGLLGRALERHLAALRGVPPGELVAGRYARYRRIGSDLPAV